MKLAILASRDGAVIALALMIFLLPTVGVPSELMLQDTLKSMVASFGALVAAALFFWQSRSATEAHTQANTEPWRWHWVTWLPLSLMGYALASMVWSHTYLAGVEAIRWFIVSLLLWLGLNTFKRENFTLLAHAIHWGAVAASLWVVMQFLLDIRWFPQGPNPASTFVNRNFFAEFVVCTVPFSFWLVAQAQGRDQIVLRTFLLAFNITALLMTGTRSALLALTVLIVLLGVIAFRFRASLKASTWTRTERWLAILTLIGTVYGLGSVPTGNAALKKENWGETALERTFFRVGGFSADQEFVSGSGSVRLVMWKATLRMIQDVPLTGVGAGAWEVDIPLYQQPGAQMETDFYAHNEYLQLIGEYGVLGWLFLIGLALFLAGVARRTWLAAAASPDAAFRAIALASLAALLLVSGAGFPWRMATTGALLALLLGILTASDQRAVELQISSVPGALWRRANLARLGLAGSLAGLCLAGYISWQATLAESKIITAAKMALTISASGVPNDARWADTKERMLTLVTEGIAITPHYRKITPTVADQLASWGDWKNAMPIWQSIVSSRPHIAVVLSNIARGYLQLNDIDKSIEYLAKAKAIQADAPAVRALEVVLLTQTAQEDKALRLTHEYLNSGNADAELVDLAVSMGTRAKDWPLTIQALKLRGKGSPALASDSWLRIGAIYLETLNDEAQALQAFRSAVAAAPEMWRDRVRERVPESVRGRL
jgi:O-antigen ligase